ncbi:polyadenylate-binding protein-interacting protein 2-like [Gigantopelta aegis]|uniref:polyadenylate-binding protein-interacting protein 2-like n=1 Tax=Gigantopelta aegis TaxID=1735272 RepID=UPI001B88BF2F|nr:polyadenylate-binding protein-interacting protein 2-like [Gigantopelta aegis]
MAYYIDMRTPPGLIEEEARENVTPNVEVDFSEYMWMADELDEFDRQVEEELLEEAFIEACFEEMFAEEEAAHWLQQNAHGQNGQFLPQIPEVCSLEDSLRQLDIGNCGNVSEEVVLNSKLNPEAPEFVPRYLKS